MLKVSTWPPREPLYILILTLFFSLVNFPCSQIPIIQKSTIELYKSWQTLYQQLLVWHVPLAQVLPRPQLIFPSKTWFSGIYLNFQQQKSLENHYLPHSKSKLTKYIPLNHAHQDVFKNIKGTFEFLQNFQLQFNLIFSEEIIQYS